MPPSPKAEMDTLALRLVGVLPDRAGTLLDGSGGFELVWDRGPHHVVVHAWPEGPFAHRDPEWYHSDRTNVTFRCGDLRDGQGLPNDIRDLLCRGNCEMGPK